MIEKRGVVEYQFPRPDGSLQRVVLESGAATAFPVTDDDAVLIALMTLSDLASRPVGGQAFAIYAAVRGLCRAGA